MFVSVFTNKCSDASNIFQDCKLFSLPFYYLETKPVQKRNTVQELRRGIHADLGHRLVSIPAVFLRELFSALEILYGVS